ncbi:signal peptidase I [Lactonifactor longoviformis]|uniref:signal peptidase I n=1 Tax=Lactonifactor TaxID=420345 RepID=UPI0012B07E57|nr:MULTISPECIES: signal peptidase I [Lactonifactor]MCB5711735.1 signal peptidase I [Lactonifactor longoviformis]MCB5715701.1 signal peptidase I [Lactonifactor longoviformis]MCQ4672852.1 signal peptidase I [Lactonifactor longoviformis]MSA02677.1 signal peptidase I [Lactonifactor sp. BIOML-A5]MSA09043.1 signal peptidase I [Lactonifactor sp. BIOML-A4]
MKKKLFAGSKGTTENKKMKSILLWVFEIAVVLVLAAVVSIFFCQSIVMQEGSMEPTLATQDKILINKVIYKIKEPQRGDIIAFKNSPEDHASIHIKRVIGLPGEKIQIKDGQILINGKTYMEKKDFPQISNGGLAEQTITLGKDEYFVLGDNRNNSEDSRYGDVGNVKKKYIVGKLWFVISPRSKFGFLES